MARETPFQPGLAMAYRIVKYGAVSLLIGIGVICLWIAYRPDSPSRLDASVRLVPSGGVVTIHIQPSHPYLAEYDRTLVFHQDGVPDHAVDMFPDTGGYLRTQLYLLPDKTLLVTGFFDAFQIDPVHHTTVEYTKTGAHDGVYLGAFDRDAHRVWRFITANQSAEQVLVPGGG